MNSLLQIDNLHVSYHSSGSTVDVLHGISLKVREGQRIGIVGESGSGKSQTALSVMRLLTGRPGITNGRITCNGTDLTKAGEKKMNSIRGHDIAIIFQDAKASLIPYLTIKEQVLDTAKSLGYGRSDKEMLELAKNHLKEMNFSEPERILTADESGPTETGRYRARQLLDDSAKKPEGPTPTSPTPGTDEEEPLPDPFGEGSGGGSKGH